MPTTKITKDPVCGMELNDSTVTEKLHYEGNDYYFCSVDCKQKFAAEPHRYLHEIVSVKSESIPSNMAERCELPLVGMHCASCAGRIEKALGSTSGVVSANVNFATNRATVQYDPQATDIKSLSQVVRDLGYDVISTTPADGHSALEDMHEAENKLREAEYHQQKVRFTVALTLTIPVAVLAMAGHMFPALADVLNFPGRAWVELILATPVLFWAGREFFSGAWAAAQHRVADMNTLVSLGTDRKSVV